MTNNFFYIDQSSYNPGYFLIRVNVNKIPFKTTIGSLNVLPARLLNLSYANYLRFCRDILRAEIHGKNHLYPVAYFKGSRLLEEFLNLLNARAKFILWEEEHPDFEEHKKALENFDKERNLRKFEN